MATVDIGFVIEAKSSSAGKAFACTTVRFWESRWKNSCWSEPELDEEEETMSRATMDGRDEESADCKTAKEHTEKTHGGEVALTESIIAGTIQTFVIDKWVSVEDSDSANKLAGKKVIN